jgi:hypothetical protein
MLFLISFRLALIPFKSQLAYTYSVTTMYIIIKLDAWESEMLMTSQKSNLTMAPKELQALNYSI